MTRKFGRSSFMFVIAHVKAAWESQLYTGWKQFVNCESEDRTAHRNLDLWKILIISFDKNKSVKLSSLDPLGIQGNINAEQNSCRFVDQFSHRVLLQSI